LASTHPHHRSASLTDASILPVLGNGRKSVHLKEVPPSKELREQIRQQAAELIVGLDKGQPMARHEMESHARRLLDGLGLPDGYVGWTMVAIGSAFWSAQVESVPTDRRLLLLPHCLRPVETCPAQYNAAGLLCEECGACPLGGLKAHARQRGYKVLIAEGSPAVMKIILGGHVDAVLGVACLDALERTLDKVLLAGIPCMAVPLTIGGCGQTAGDPDWVLRMIDTPHRSQALETRTYLHLMRLAAKMFEPDELERLLPRRRSAPRLSETNGDGLMGIEAVACTEAIAYDFLAGGGKHSRPFITLAVYDALRGGGSTLPGGAQQAAKIPDAVRRIALAIEVFHKASLIHDDVEDNDDTRYGHPTLHQKYGQATAINVGDYLIGMGYRLVAGQAAELGAEMAADVLDQFALAHTKLCEGQGAELVWRDSRDKRLPPLEALKIYALKTAPAFEAAMMAGVRLAGAVEPYRDAITRYSRHLGVAYQMINDLDDWQVDDPGEGHRGTDLLGGRPTVLWALALESLSPEAREELERLPNCDLPRKERIGRAIDLYAEADVFAKAAMLVSKHHRRAAEAAEAIDVEPLRRFLHFLADAILDRRPLAVNEN
jgi:geranylgeranyl pyrophosphate synthase